MIDAFDGIVNAYAIAVNLPYAIAMCAVAAEVAWLARRPGPQRASVLRAARTAVVMAGGAFVVGIAYTAMFRSLWSALSAHRWEAGASFLSAHPVVGALLTFVAWDAAGWVYHLVGHRTRIGWAAHQPHHTGEAFDATLGLRQTWVPFHGLAYQPLLALAGFDVRVLFVCAAISNCWQVLEHTSVRVPWPRWFVAAIMTPDAHRHHHAAGVHAVNLGPVFTVWDRVTGTWLAPWSAPEPVVYGLGDGASTTRPVAIELAGWRALAYSQSRRLKLRYSSAQDTSISVSANG